MTVKDKPPVPMIVKSANGLRPSRAWDAEALMADPLGTEYEVTRVSKRKQRGHRTYWLALKRVCDATGKWPTPIHLHEEIKLACGYYRKAINLATKQEMLIPDSTAFDKMDQVAFVAYERRAMEVLAGAIGFDPMEFLEQ